MLSEELTTEPRNPLDQTNAKVESSEHHYDLESERYGLIGGFRHL